ncbi:metallophosphoesterase [Myroides odoratus]|uniref:acid phosphatase n=1 Tax=Myroides odoratus TaxID=256 RepID=A0A378U4E0_MYROD|nr:metallophosphoesterase [Myroides odoratus]QQU02774.1 metallophosphoesterase [Myroides odoratus]STZ69997.1 Calcineurin-like phosphoesterase [Myroides odoratus]
MKKILYTLVLLSFTGLTQAQTAFEYEKSTGYSGQDIPSLVHQEDSFNFLVLGDFGRVGDYYQKEVAREMGNAMVVLDGEFVVSVGDNFYPNGVASTQDYHWTSSFEQVYTNPSLYADWYVALGNHDYLGNVQAQVDYTKISRRWNMPDRYYSKTFKLENGKKLLLVVMDTNPFIDNYRKSSKYGDLKEQDTEKQMQWLEQTLGQADADVQWKIVVGHHPMYSGGKRKVNKDTQGFEQQFAAFFDRHQVDAYICGHEHDLQIIKPKNRYTTQFLSGAASEVRPSGTMEHTVFAAAEPGFMAFSILNTSLTVQVVKANKEDAEVLYTHTIQKKK